MSDIWGDSSRRLATRAGGEKETSEVPRWPRADPRGRRERGSERKERLARVPTIFPLEARPRGAAGGRGAENKQQQQEQS